MRWLLVVTALALGGCDMRVGGPAPPQSSSRFTLAADEQGGVWRLDSQSGELKHCTIAGDAQVHCSTAAP